MSYPIQIRTYMIPTYYSVFIGWLFYSLAAISCQDSTLHATKQPVAMRDTLLQQDKLIITQIAPNTFIHTSYLQTNSFGKVDCNGMLVRDGNEVVVYDTPVDDSTAETLIRFVQDSLGCRINAVIATHFHVDCLGGLQAFHQHQIPSYAYQKTIELAQSKKFPIPQHGITNDTSIAVGNTHTRLAFMGQGHTIDNTIGYFHTDKILFGGCLIKALGANTGNLEDANTQAWVATMHKIIQQYSDINWVIPGHGAIGDKQLLYYTRDLIDSFNIHSNSTK